MAMREIPREPDNQRFLLKAIGEAGRELAEELYGIGRREADRRDRDGWSYRLIAAHVRDNEEITLSYLERILARRNPALEALDNERVLDDPSRVTEDIDQLVSEFLYLRRQTQYLLYDLSASAWERCGVHEYRGSCSVLQLARELNQHDLEHLWQARRMRESAVRARR
jgi:DinB family protein